jgi:hypothetical protein
MIILTVHLQTTFFLFFISIRVNLQIISIEKCRLYILSRDRVTIDGVWVDNWIY